MKMPVAILLPSLCILGTASAADSLPVDMPRRTEKFPLKQFFQRVDFPGIDDPKVTVAQILELLAKQHGVPIDVDERAFKFENVMDVLTCQLADPNPIQPMRDVRLDLLLRRLLNRVPAPTGATILLRRTHIEVTTGQFLQSEVWGDGAGGPFLPIVHLDADDRPLSEVLRDLSEQVDANIYLDPRVGEAGRTRISTHLRNAPLDTALGIIGDSIGAKTIVVNNVLYLTTNANAARHEAWLQRDQALRKARLADPFAQGDLMAIGDRRFQQVLAVPRFQRR